MTYKAGDRLNLSNSKSSFNVTAEVCGRIYLDATIDGCNSGNAFVKSEWKITYLTPEWATAPGALLLDGAGFPILRRSCRYEVLAPGFSSFPVETYDTYERLVEARGEVRPVRFDDLPKA